MRLTRKGRETSHSSYNIVYVLVRHKPCLINTDIQVVLEDNLDPLLNKDVRKKCYKNVFQLKLLIMQLTFPIIYNMKEFLYESTAKKL